MNAIFDPLGEKSGNVEKPLRWVTWRCFVPFCFIAQISHDPLASEQ